MTIVECFAPENVQLEQLASSADDVDRKRLNSMAITWAELNTRMILVKMPKLNLKGHSPSHVGIHTMCHVVTDLGIIRHRESS